ncbi:unnamed protein product [Symbiodinium natans]|uniref:Uncharacterized protein n=1 Tax=Symbiodinium natans TaxID=878477 RepID=A0A812QHG7_9DINO|nr:unnamed protein product [Symbiodinium natans]
MPDGEAAAEEGGAFVPFRLTEAKLTQRIPVGSEPYFGRLSQTVDTAITNTVAIFNGSEPAGR